eukprot:gnl/TRDRNA2_/TRDRNA2_130786_c0_seq1.p1 gnl/TRDRNA2_/TRDRNA2_130786_c0~~gnl/TRDRNA2_/TRDRNA2_130786_c0_seq1.p1  ORF type:complete len:148 (+),score=32.39 gnl/TRDRNA2_/TRDRNA2_130786_c0_seq1:119-562(+)
MCRSAIVAAFLLAVNAPQAGGESADSDFARSQQYFKRGASYTGELTGMFKTESGDGTEHASIRLNMLSDKIGRWRDENDHEQDTQKVTIIHRGDSIKLLDDNTVLEGSIDEHGIVRGKVSRGGFEHGDFVLTPDSSGTDFTAPRLRR